MVVSWWVAGSMGPQEYRGVVQVRDPHGSGPGAQVPEDGTYLTARLPRLHRRPGPQGTGRHGDDRRLVLGTGPKGRLETTSGREFPRS